MIKNFIILFFLAISSMANAFLVQGYDVSKAWESAQVHVPSNFFVKNVNNVKVDAPLPVVIFLHGCGGINDHEIRWATFLKSKNFIVVLPNSFAIPNRQTNCTSTLPNRMVWRVPVDHLRPAEAEYALSKIKELEWADKNNIFLMGFSEGGMAAHNAKEDGFAGIIMSGFPCALRNPIKSHFSTPTLVLNWEIDPDFIRNDGSYQQCSDKPYWQWRTNSTEILLEGKGHFNAHEPKAREAVLNFLIENKNN
jgi:poly(3-hydroxybutyrate) depolymerase